ncbi:hypothetical protein TRIATDRAFT_88387 [Trichoderma atroviride IMI 206040]|uniref:Uncharacterized protein n=1 Tax=Hypocrea atroviridis (strain ATCC 20476 / IMI 206040) TaxID=452589 RepID=G9NX25_HYPAI|nr:uncharacterized protein TRIATDRAFT_88387 [Trichoderma atroviride IMI 206040]EHK44678.1 hypothetical protein TRIATDRAFT_88387 [Trichoderma atroviride IMI 206040]
MSLLRLLVSSEPQCGVLGVPTGTDDHQRIPGIDRSFDEVALWEEFEVIKRSAEWHVGQYIKFWDRCENADGDPAVLGHSKRRNQLDESLFKSNGSKDRWRLKVEHDKAVRELLTIQRIFSILVADEERITGYRCYGIVSSLSHGAYVSLRVLVIDKCRQMVGSLEDRVRTGAVNREDQELFDKAWFIPLNWFQLEE